MVNIFVSDDEFARLVSEDVKNKVSSRQKEILLSPSNWTRWRRALLILLDNVSNQLEDIKIDRESDKDRYQSMGEHGTTLFQESETAYSSRLLKIERFKFHINRRIDDVTKLIETESSTSKISFGLEIDDEANFLKKAITQHRILYEKFDIEPTGIDSALWRALSNEWLFEELNESNI